jgi:nucleotide-binding universal stress UspA family protein
MSDSRQLVVVGIDSEEPSFIALEWVIERCAHVPSRVRLVAVENAPVWGSKRALARLTVAAGRLASTRPDVPVEIRILRDTSIAEGLAIESQDADLLVVGHHRGRIIRSAVAGAVPMQIAKRAACPVIIVPADWLRRYGKTVVGVEADKESESAVAFAAEETVRFGRSLDIVHVDLDLEHPGSTRTTPAPDVPEERTVLLSRSTAAARRGHRTLAVRTFDDDGDPDRILRAHAREAALIVVGNHGAGAVESLLHGSRAYDLMNWSKAPLCVVPSGWRPAALEEVST